jgi:soluble lytic murein transglycosylase-like protein
MFGGRQTVAVWGSFALSCLLAVEMQRPEEAQHHPVQWVEGSTGMSLPIESSPFAGPTPFEQRVITVATREGLDPALVLAGVEVESRQVADAVSPDAADPAKNLEAGCKYLSALLDSFGGDVELALAAYNAGPGAVRHWGTVPPYRETKAFIARVAAEYERLTGLDIEGATRFSYDPSLVF